MNIFVLLPFINVRYIAGSLKRSAKLTPDYVKQFKTKATLDYIATEFVLKDPNYYTRIITYGYTRIPPETLRLS